MATRHCTRAPGALENLPHGASLEHTPDAPRHTPGPWHEHSHRQIGPEAGIVCEVWSAIGWGDEAISQADANVRLIASAPELYHVLSTLVANYSQPLALPSARTMQLAREVLAKVQGVNHERD